MILYQLISPEHNSGNEMEPDSPKIEELMRCFSANLNEKDRRLYAGYEASQFSHGVHIYIASYTPNVQFLGF